MTNGHWERTNMGGIVRPPPLGSRYASPIAPEADAGSPYGRTHVNPFPPACPSPCKNIGVRLCGTDTTFGRIPPLPRSSDSGVAQHDSARPSHRRHRATHPTVAGKSRHADAPCDRFSLCRGDERCQANGTTHRRAGSCDGLQVVSARTGRERTLTAASSPGH
jgi:hypothetical protein